MIQDFGYQKNNHRDTESTEFCLSIFSQSFLCLRGEPVFLYSWFPLSYTIPRCAAGGYLQKEVQMGKAAVLRVDRNF